ncbi:glycine zipper 2TM domain-containing protein [Sphingomonas bacterium]|uniref:glycine zipper 2TM domain-containing protein n=1 Tax=Sphingomonas bacterium TaxID=1895847 RepID=UPI0026350E0B|nr:glycine zipper 2TM domain-containing protein [Sphingomonas bacterium]MDB5679609.1 glycine zipper protein [Sphingomonas bacterium]
MRSLTLGLVAAATALTGCSTMYDDGPNTSYRTYRNYDYNRPDPQYQGYYADQYYVDNQRYRERRLSRNDRIYAGRDGRYYCRRSDGTTGLIVGGIAGGALGAALTSGRSEPLGILLGAAAGAAAGAAIDQDNVRCR